MTKISRAIANFDYAVRLKKDPDKTKVGKFYVVGYRNEMEKLPDGRRRSRVAEQFHIGPLQDDNSVKLGKAFLKRYPNFEGAEVYYLKNRLLTKSQYKKAIQAKVAEATPDDTQAMPPGEEAAKSLDFARSLVFEHFAKKNHLLQLLREVFGGDGTKLYSLLIYVATAKKAFEHYNDFQNSNYIACGQDLSSQRISEILGKVTENKMEKFWRVMMRTSLTGTENFCGLALDSTSISTYSELIELAEWGHNKQDEPLKQVNLTAITDVKTGRAVYAREVPGSVPDVTSFGEAYQHVLNRVLPKDRVYLIMDRGYESNANLLMCLKANQHFVMGAKVGNIHLKDQFIRNTDEILKSSNRIPSATENIYGITGNPIQIWEKTEEGEQRYTLTPRLYINTSRRTLLSNDLDEKLCQTRKLRNENQTVPANVWALTKGLVYEKDGVWHIDDAAVAERRKLMGCFAIWTTFAEDSAEETLLKYHERNEIEEQFRWLKSEKRGSRLYQTDNSYRGVLMLNLLAASLRQQLSKAIKRSDYCREVNVTSVENYLSKLDGLRVKYTGQKWRVEKPTAKRRRLLEALKIEIAN